MALTILDPNSALIVLWGFFNIVAGYALVCRFGASGLRNTTNVLAPGAGAFLIALFAARHFGRFHGGNAAEQP